jgi:hypothetical protein
VVRSTLDVRAVVVAFAAAVGAGGCTRIIDAVLPEGLRAFY